MITFRSDPTTADELTQLLQENDFRVIRTVRTTRKGQPQKRVIMVKVKQSQGNRYKLTFVE